MRAFVGVSFVLSLLVAGCGDPHGVAGWPGAVDVVGGSGAQFSEGYVRMSPGFSERPAEELAVIREITARHEEVFDGGPPSRVLGETELLFLANGQLADLVGFYEQAVERQGEGSPILPRLAWVTQRIGLEDRGLALARRAVEERPDDPFAHFVLAFCLGQQSDRFDDPFDEVVALLDRVFELDPAFEVPGVVDNRSLRSEQAALRAEHDHSDRLE